MTCLSDVLSILPDMADRELEAVIEAATSILERRRSGDGDEPEERIPVPVSANGGGGRRVGSKGWLEIKTIKGRQYLYRRWRDGKIQRSEYVGKVEAPAGAG